MIGQTWWSRMVNAVRFLNDAHDSLMSGKSVVLHFPGEIPWQELLIEELERKLGRTSDDRMFRVHSVKDVKEDPGEYLFRHYCSEEERGNYWAPTHQTYERFLAMSPKTTLTHRYLCLKDVNSENCSRWIKSISDYTEACEKDAEHGLFILLSQGAAPRSTKSVNVYQYANYITDYDCLMLCQTLISSLSCSSAAKQYISEVASNLADNQVELAGMLVSYKMELIQKPESVAWEVFTKENIACENLREKVNTALWEAQVKIIFPLLERYRRDLIQKHQHQLKKHLPMPGSDGKMIHSLNELELGELYFLCYNHKLLSTPEFNRLVKMRDARNSLAHWGVIPYSELVNELQLI